MVDSKHPGCMVGEMIRATKLTSAIGAVLMVAVAETELPFWLSELSFLAVLIFLVFGTSLWWGPHQPPTLSKFASRVDSGEMGRHLRETVLPAWGRMLIFFIGFTMSHWLWQAAKGHFQ